jgi:hypothetical protein
MPTAVGKTKFLTPADATITLASLASNNNGLTGRQSTAIDCGTLNAKGLWVWGGIKVAASGLSAGTIEVHAVASMDGTTWPGGFTGTDAGRTFASQSSKDQLATQIAAIATDATGDVVYEFGPVFVPGLYNGQLPKAVVLWVNQFTGANLAATGSYVKYAVTQDQIDW